MIVESDGDIAGEVVDSHTGGLETKAESVVGNNIVLASAKSVNRGILGHVPAEFDEVEVEVERDLVAQFVVHARNNSEVEGENLALSFWEAIRLAGAATKTETERSLGEESESRTNLTEIVTEIRSNIEEVSITLVDAKFSFWIKRFGELSLVGNSSIAKSQTDLHVVVDLIATFEVDTKISGREFVSNDFAVSSILDRTEIHAEVAADDELCVCCESESSECQS